MGRECAYTLIRVSTFRNLLYFGDSLGWLTIYLFFAAWKVEILGLYKVLIKEPWIILLFPAFLSSNWCVHDSLFVSRFATRIADALASGSTLSVLTLFIFTFPILTSETFSVNA
jgi:hypothetical protein